MLYNQEFDITAEASEGGTITPAGDSKVKYSQSLSYTITAADGYRIADVIVDGTSVGAVETYRFDNVRKAHTISAIFEKLPWKNPFADVSENDRFYEDIRYVFENGMMIGTGEDQFSPDSTLTRASLSQFCGERQDSLL